MRTTLVTALLLLSSSHALATERTFHTPSFFGVSLAQGMDVTIKCGKENTLTVSGDEILVSKLTWQVRNDILTVNSPVDQDIDLDSEPKTLDVTITSKTPISMVDAKSGVAVNMTKCSYNSDNLNINGTNGVSYSVSGVINTLNLVLSKGGDFNHAAQNLRINQANIDLSAGVNANVCGAKSVQGSVSTGSQIVVGKSTDADNLQLSFDDQRIRQACQ